MKCIICSKILQKRLRLSSLDDKMKYQHNLRVNFRNLWDMVWPFRAANHTSQMITFGIELKITTDQKQKLFYMAHFLKSPVTK
jgi:hypothetical protein